MTDPSNEFFEQLSKRGQVKEFGRSSGTLRIDLKEKTGSGSRWFVRISKGNVSVSRKNGGADCVLSCDKATFDRVVTGRTNAMAATLRGAVGFEGDATMLVLFQRLFPAERRLSAGNGGSR